MVLLFIAYCSYWFSPLLVFPFSSFFFYWYSPLLLFPFTYYPFYWIFHVLFSTCTSFHFSCFPQFWFSFSPVFLFTGGLVFLFTGFLVFPFNTSCFYWSSSFTGFPLTGLQFNRFSSLMVFSFDSFVLSTGFPLHWFSPLPVSPVLVFTFLVLPFNSFALHGFPLSWLSLFLGSPLLAFPFSGFPIFGFPWCTNWTGFTLISFYPRVSGVSHWISCS